MGKNSHFVVVTTRIDFSLEIGVCLRRGVALREKKGILRHGDLR